MNYSNKLNHHIARFFLKKALIIANLCLTVGDLQKWGLARMCRTRFLCLVQLERHLKGKINVEGGLCSSWSVDGLYREEGGWWAERTFGFDEGLSSQTNKTFCTEGKLPWTTTDGGQLYFKRLQAHHSDWGQSRRSSVDFEKSAIWWIEMTFFLGGKKTSGRSFFHHFSGSNSNPYVDSGSIGAI